VFWTNLHMFVLDNPIVTAYVRGDLSYIETYLITYLEDMPYDSVEWSLRL
jgi:hypothetical protein